jgi:ribulose kinase
VYQLLNERLERLAGRRNMAELTARYHVLGYHHGNRSPRANPLARGMVSGLSLNDTIDELAQSYLATIQAVAYGTRHIVEAMNRKGYAIDCILACGGGTKNPVFLQQHADITGRSIHLPREPEAVLLGTAVLAAVAGGAYTDCVEATGAMTRTGGTIRPAGGRIRQYHERKFKVFKQMYQDQLRYARLMDTAP